MSNQNIIRAWKDQDYFDSLSQEESSLLPENPAGMLELSDEEMNLIVGGKKKDKSLKHHTKHCTKHYTKKCMYVVSNFCDVSVGMCASFVC